MIKLKSLLILAFVSIFYLISFDAKAQEDDWDDDWGICLFCDDPIDVEAECLYCHICWGAGCEACEPSCYLPCGCCGSCCECDPSICLEEAITDFEEEEPCELSCGCCGNCCECDPSSCNQPEPEKDCAGVINGSAYMDDCGNCVGGNTGAIACDPCKDEMVDMAEIDVESCSPRKDASELSSQNNCSSTDLQQQYNEAYNNALQDMYSGNIGTAEIQTSNEMRCAPLSIQYLSCASQEEVMEKYMRETQNNNIDPCSFTNGGFSFPGVSGANMEKTLGNHINYTTVVNGAHITSLNQISQLHNYVLQSNVKYLIVSQHSTGAHVFVVDEKGSNINSMTGYDPNLGIVSNLDAQSYININNTIWIYKFNNCK